MGGKAPERIRVLMLMQGRSGFRRREEYGRDTSCKSNWFPLICMQPGTTASLQVSTVGWRLNWSETDQAR